jgi:hypothetical protein
VNREAGSRVHQFLPRPGGKYCSDPTLIFPSFKARNNLNTAKGTTTSTTSSWDNAKKENDTGKAKETTEIEGETTTFNKDAKE